MQHSKKGIKKILKKSLITHNSLTHGVYLKWITLPYVFNNSRSYWIERYRLGGNSGEGSCGKLAKFKARVLNQFIREEKINTVIEYGCGDGSQLKLCNFPSYLGFDISPDVIKLCRDLFSEDDTRTFRMMSNYNDETAELTLSLDVIYHLIEDQTFNKYMHRLFDSSEKYVIIYSSNTNNNSVIEGAHVKHRKFTDWVDYWKPQWHLVKYVANKYPFKGNKKNGSLADFFIYRRT